MKFMRAKIHHLYLSGTYKNDNIYFNYDKDEHEVSIEICFTNGH